MYVPDVQAASDGEHKRECGIHFEDGDRWSRQQAWARARVHIEGRQPE